MAKKKTTKAAAKKKGAAKSTEEKKKTSQKNSAKKNSAPKNSAKKTSTAKKTSAAKTTKKTPAAKKTKKTASATKTKVTLQELLKRQFEHPENIHIESAPKGMTNDSIPDAPPFFEINDSKELSRLKKLLMQKIDITDIPPPKPKPKKIVPIAELIRQKYAVPSTSLWEAPKKDMHIPDAPPYIETSDPDRQTKIRSLLFQNISIENVKPLPDTSVAKESDPAPATPKKEKPSVPVSELLKNVYPAWSPQSVVPAPEKAQLNISDPPAFIEGSPDEIRRIRELLFQKIDLTDIPEPVQEQVTDNVEEKQAEQTETKQKDIVAPAQVDKSANDEKLKEQASIEEPVSPEPQEDDSIAAPLIPPESDYSDYTLETKKGEQLMSNSLKFVFAGIVVLFVMLYMASSSNHNKFYLIDGKSGVEVWQGTFSPMGKSFMVTLMGMETPETIQPFYTQSEIYPMICSFYLDQASEVLSEDNIPNLVQVKEYLEMAYYFATEANQQEIQKRLNGIDFMMFVLRADIAIQKGSETDLEKAREYIEEAQELVEKNYQKDMIKSRLQLIEGKIAEKKPPEAQTPHSKAEASPKKASHDQKKSDSH